MARIFMDFGMLVGSLIGSSKVEEEEDSVDSVDSVNSVNSVDSVDSVDSVAPDDEAESEVLCVV